MYKGQLVEQRMPEVLPSHTYHFSSLEECTKGYHSDFTKEISYSLWSPDMMTKNLEKSNAILFLLHITVFQN